MKLKNILSLILFSIIASTTFSAEFTVLQKNKAFSEQSLSVKVGDTVHFKNDDPFFHNVFSLSDTQFFDLGSYPQGESKPVKFEKAGKVEVECAIHPDMIMTIDVSE